MDNVIIDLEKRYNSNLWRRYAAESIFDNLENNKSEIVVDFKNIEFIGKSFAQEYVYQKDQLNNEVIEINKSDFVENMLNIVYNSFKK